MLELENMILVLDKKATSKEIKQLAEHFGGYIKVVIDVQKMILAGGADRHFEEEEFLLKRGSLQKNLWGGGFDINTGEIDYNSVINLRPNQDNPSRDILSLEIRQKFDLIIKKILTNE